MGRQFVSKSMTISTLARQLSTTYAVSERLAYAILREGVDLITSALVDGQRVHLAGLGTFKTRQKAAEKGRETPYGVVDVPDRTRAYYTPAKWLKSLPAKESKVAA